MLKDNAIPIRLDSETKKRLKDTAEKLGLTSSALIRILIVSFVEHFAASDGRIVLPLQWDISARAVVPLLDSPPRPVSGNGKTRNARSKLS